jgi:hypothetical protein
VTLPVLNSDAEDKAGAQGEATEEEIVATPAAKDKPQPEDTEKGAEDVEEAPGQQLKEDTAGATRKDSIGEPQQKKSRNRQQKNKSAGKTESQPTNAKNAAAEEATGQKANPWTRAREVLLRQKVEEKASEPGQADRMKYKKYYALAEREDYRVIPDAYPRRPLTEDELQTLFLWRSKRIHLRTPPNS